MVSIGPNVRFPSAGVVIASTLTATAVVSCCHLARPHLLLDLCLNPHVIIGHDVNLLSRCARAAAPSRAGSAG